MQTEFDKSIFKLSGSAPVFVPKQTPKVPLTKEHDKAPKTDTLSSSHPIHMKTQNAAPPTNISPQEISHDLEMLPLEFFLPSNLFDEDEIENHKVNKTVTFDLKPTIHKIDYKVDSSKLPDLSDKSPAINTVLSSGDPSLCSGEKTGVNVTYTNICKKIANSHSFKNGLSKLQTAETIYKDTCTQLALHQKKVIEDLMLTYDEARKGPNETLSKIKKEAICEKERQMREHRMKEAESIGMKFVSCSDDNTLLVEQRSLIFQAMEKQCRPLLSIGDLFKRLKEEASGIRDIRHASALELFQEVQSDMQNDTLKDFINTIDFSINRYYIYIQTENIPGFIEHSLHTIRQFNKALLSYHQLDNYSINENDLSSAWANDIFKTFDSYFSQIKNAEYEDKLRKAELVCKTSTQAALEYYNARKTYLAECYHQSLRYLRAYIQQLATFVEKHILKTCRQSFLQFANNIHQEMIYQLLRDQLTCTQFISLIKYNSTRNSPKIAPLTNPLLSNLVAFAKIRQERILGGCKEKQLDVISSCSSTMFSAPAASQDDFEIRTNSPTCNT